MKVKIILLLSFVFICQFTWAQTNRIKDFNELMASLNSGEQVRVVIHYSLCKLQINDEIQTTSPDAITGMNIDTYEYFAPGIVYNKLAFVVFGNSKLIQNPIGKGFVYNYGKVRINEDQTVQVTAKYINAKNFKEIMHEVFLGNINDGENNGGIDLFKNNVSWK